MTKVRFTKVSSNRKVGKMSVTTTERQSCPDACPFKGNGCYADGFPLAGVWNRVPEEGHDWGDLDPRDVYDKMQIKYQYTADTKLMNMIQDL